MDPIGGATHADAWIRELNELHHMIEVSAYTDDLAQPRRERCIKLC